MTTMTGITRQTAQCKRCQGLMVLDQSLGFLDTGDDISIWTWRCIACGNIVDPVILRNRRAQQAPIRAREMAEKHFAAMHETPTAA